MAIWIYDELKDDKDLSEYLQRINKKRLKSCTVPVCSLLAKMWAEPGKVKVLLELWVQLAGGQHFSNFMLYHIVTSFDIVRHVDL